MSRLAILAPCSGCRCAARTPLHVAKCAKSLAQRSGCRYASRRRNQYHHVATASSPGSIVSKKRNSRAGFGIGVPHAYSRILSCLSSGLVHRRS